MLCTAHNAASKNNVFGRLAAGEIPAPPNLAW